MPQMSLLESNHRSNVLLPALYYRLGCIRIILADQNENEYGKR